MNTTETDYYRLASGFYLAVDLPDNYLKMDDEEFDKFLEENAWEPYEYYPASDLRELIEGLSWMFERVARDARNQTK